MVLISLFGEGGEWGGVPVIIRTLYDNQYVVLKVPSSKDAAETQQFL